MIEHMFDMVERSDPESEATLRRVEARIAELMGVINVATAELVEVAAEAIDSGSWGGAGLHSPAHWLAWRTGLAPGRARDLAKIVERRHELPTTAASFAAGELTLDQAAVIAHHVPEGYDQQATEFARVATVSQLRRTLPQFGWDVPPAKRDEGDGRSVIMGHDARGRWSMRAKLPAEEGAVVEKALRAHRDDLFHQHNDHLPSGADPVRVDNADALLSLAEIGLRRGEAAHPHSTRYLVTAHLDAGSTPGDDAVAVGRLSVHWGPLLPAAVRRQLLCDATIVASLERHGVPVSLGRKARVADAKLRTAIERRDGGCAVPGCGSRVGTEIHHIWHWEDGGPTDSHNLLGLCRRHHRLHHQGALGITGNADLPAGTDGCVEFRDQWGHRLDPSGRPVPPRPGTRPEAAAQGAGLAPVIYRCPTGERLDRSALVICPNRDTVDRAPVTASPSSPVDFDRPSNDPRPLHLVATAADPARAGPV